MSGFLNPIGLISEPVSQSLGIPITEAVARFGYFTVGVFFGYLVSFFVFDFITLRLVVIFGYGLDHGMKHFTRLAEGKRTKCYAPDVVALMNFFFIVVVSNLY